jgi:hypothetical protein
MKVTTVEYFGPISSKFNHITWTFRAETDSKLPQGQTSFSGEVRAIGEFWQAKFSDEADWQVPQPTREASVSAMVPYVQCRAEEEEEQKRRTLIEELSQGLAALVRVSDNTIGHHDGKTIYQRSSYKVQIDDMTFQKVQRLLRLLKLHGWGIK